MLVGNAAIKKDKEASIANRAKGSTLSYDVMDAFGGDNYVTEVGKTIRKDSTGKITTTGKYNLGKTFWKMCLHPRHW